MVDDLGYKKTTVAALAILGVRFKHRALVTTPSVTMPSVTMSWLAILGVRSKQRALVTTPLVTVPWLAILGVRSAVL